MEEKVENQGDSPAVSAEKQLQNEVQNGFTENIGVTTDLDSNLDIQRPLESIWQKVLTKFLILEFALVPIAIFLIYLFDLPNSGSVAGQIRPSPAVFFKCKWR